MTIAWFLFYFATAFCAQVAADNFDKDIDKKVVEERVKPDPEPAIVRPEVRK